MKIDIITIFPQIFDSYLKESLIARAQKKRLINITVNNLRKWTNDPHKTVDDRPFGGGSGMVMQVEPIQRALLAIQKKKRSRSKVILMCPQGEKFNQKMAKRLATGSDLIIICGHYEGIDERVRVHLADMQVSIGDYVLTGGELPAMVLVDALTRLIPGVLGDRNSLNFESFEGNLLEYPQYTRPAQFKKWGVPEILLSGAHDKILVWRKEQSLKRTKQNRPDLIKNKKRG